NPDSWPPLHVIAGDYIYVQATADETDVVHALNLADGTEAWSFPMTANASGELAATEHAIYVASGDWLQAVSTGTFNEQWRVQFDGGVSQVLVFADTVYVRSSRGLVALDTRTGQNQVDLDPGCFFGSQSFAYAY